MAIAKKITINDVAQAAGVSVSTVSLVLSGKGRISSATGERVNHAIEQLGFVRNRQAASLRGGPTRLSRRGEWCSSLRGDTAVKKCFSVLIPWWRKGSTA